MVKYIVLIYLGFPILWNDGGAHFEISNILYREYNRANLWGVLVYYHMWKIQHECQYQINKLKPKICESQLNYVSFLLQQLSVGLIQRDQVTPFFDMTDKLKQLFYLTQVYTHIYFAFYVWLLGALVKQNGNARTAAKKHLA